MGEAKAKINKFNFRLVSQFVIYNSTLHRGNKRQTLDVNVKRENFWSYVLINDLSAFENFLLPVDLRGLSDTHLTLHGIRVDLTLKEGIRE